MKKVFVSGCYDILHAGHIEFFKQAKSLGDYLIVSFASDEALLKYKGKKSALPEQHKRAVLESLSMVDEVVMGGNADDSIFDFKDIFIKIKPDILVSTEDDKNSQLKKEFCKKYGAKYVQLPKSLGFEKISTTEIRQRINTPSEICMRVDFAGGWLDVPKFSKKGAYVVNCAITPKVGLYDWLYEKKSGLGGSAAYSILSGNNPISTELDLGVGWQDPAIMLETGLCVWRSGHSPVLEIKVNPDFLNGKMALLWTGQDHDTPGVVNKKRDYSKIKSAGKFAFEGAIKKDLKKLCKGVDTSYKAQLLEGMQKLPEFNEMVKKYCGGGYGGYALYIFDSDKNRKKFLKNKNTLPIEPYINSY
jgi:cytidyltransferase-like protein